MHQGVERRKVISKEVEGENQSNRESDGRMAPTRAQLQEEQHTVVTRIWRGGGGVVGRIALLLELRDGRLRAREPPRLGAKSGSRLKVSQREPRAFFALTGRCSL